MAKNDSDWKEGVVFFIKNDFFIGWVKATSSNYKNYFYVNGCSGVFGSNEYHQITD